MPSYMPELTFLVLNMFLAKFYNETFFDAMSFFNLGVPFMLYLICMLFSNLLEFIKQILIDDINDESDSILTPKVLKLLQRIIRDLFAYFGIYYFSA